MDTAKMKEHLGRTIVDRFVQSGMKIGLGTGSTAIHAVRRVGELVQSGELERILAVSTSFGSTLEAQRYGIPLRTMNDPDIDTRVDIAIDGADEVDTRSLYLIKGGGGSLTREKIVGYRSSMFYVIVDESKLSNRLGTRHPLPVECIPEASAPVERALASLGCRPVLRMAKAKSGPVVTDNGNLIFDLDFQGADFDAVALETEINRIPGVLETGLFTALERRVFVGRADGTIEELTVQTQ